SPVRGHQPQRTERRMRDLQRYVDEALGSLYFSGARIDEYLRAFLDDQHDACAECGSTVLRDARHLYLVGSGGSFAAVQTAKYVLDTVVDVPIDALASYELVWRDPARLGRGSVVVLVSYSGETEDTVAALRHAQRRGARTVAIVGKDDSLMAREADV